MLRKVIHKTALKKKKFSSGILPHLYRNIISIIASYNCWTESPYIYSEGASVQVLQKCTFSVIIMDLRHKRQRKIRRFSIYNMTVK